MRKKLFHAIKIKLTTTTTYLLYFKGYRKISKMDRPLQRNELIISENVAASLHLYPSPFPRNLQIFYDAGSNAQYFENLLIVTPVTFNKKK